MVITMSKTGETIILLVKASLLLSAVLIVIPFILFYELLKKCLTNVFKFASKPKFMERKKLLLVALPLVLGVSIAVGYIATNVFGVGASVVFISGTEYQQGEVGQVIVRVVNAWGMPISANYCNVTVYYPNKTVFINNQSMTEGGAPGSWYYEFTTPFTQIGVYEEYVVCQVTLPGGPRLIGAGSSFHVSQTLTMLNETASARVVIIS